MSKSDLIEWLKDKSIYYLIHHFNRIGGYQGYQGGYNQGGYGG